MNGVLEAARVAARTGRFDTGVDLAGMALGTFVLTRDEGACGQALNLLGGIAFDRGRLDPAARYFDDAIALAERAGDLHTAAKARNNLASLEHLRGRPAVALGLYRSAGAIYHDLDDRAGAAQTHHNLGLLHRDLAEYDEAAVQVTEAVRLAGTVDDGRLLGLVLTGRAELAIARHRPAEAKADLVSARKAADSAGDAGGVAEADRLLGALALEENDPRAALRLADAAARAAEAIGAAVQHAEAVALASRALRALGRVAEADAGHTSAVNRLEALGAATALRRIKGEWHAAR